MRKYGILLRLVLIMLYISKMMPPLPALLLAPRTSFNQLLLLQFPFVVQWSRDKKDNRKLFLNQFLNQFLGVGQFLQTPHKEVIIGSFFNLYKAFCNFNYGKVRLRCYLIEQLPYLSLLNVAQSEPTLNFARTFKSFFVNNALSEREVLTLSINKNVKLSLQGARCLHYVPDYVQCIRVTYPKVPSSRPIFY